MSDALIPYGQNVPERADEVEAVVSQALTLWERRGRGWRLADFPVELEPSFCPLYLLVNAPAPPVFDDGRAPSFLSGLFGGRANENAAALAQYREEIAHYRTLLASALEPEFCGYYNADFTELQLVLPKELKPAQSVAENLLRSLSYLSHPVSFEIIGSRHEIVVQFAATQNDLPHLKQQLSAHLPGCTFRETADYLYNLWLCGAGEELIVDFGLSNDLFYPLDANATLDADYLVTAIGGLSDLEEDEIGVLQILFQKTGSAWSADIVESVEYLTGTEQLPKTALHFAKEKVRAPLFAAAVRAAGKSHRKERTWRIVKSFGAGLASLANATNELIPLSNDGFAAEHREQGLLNRQSFREGMILNLEELAALVHVPSPLVQSEKLHRESDTTKPAPALALNHALALGENAHNGESREVTLSESQRSRHIHILGSSGSGKSSLLLNLIVQDLENNQGLCVIDPHGDLIDEVIASIPQSRTRDVVLFDPTDSEFPIGFNILQANSELEKTLLSSDLVATFRRMSTSWGDVMDSVLANAILAFVESSRGGNLFDLKRFLVEKEFRSEFLTTVSDPNVRYFWQHEFPLIAGKPQSSILIRLDAFLRQKIVRNIVCQKENKIDFRALMDSRKILLVKLSQGLIGEENAQLLGTLLVSKLYQTALSRQESTSRPFFSCYLDEFQHFITPSMENILSGVRKYNLGLVLAHQEFRQLQSRSSETAASVLSNCYTRICFRLGDTDAEKFAAGFSFFDAKALQNLGIGEAIARVERADFDFNLKTELLPKVAIDIAVQRRAEVLRQSRETYATAKAEVEAAIFTAQAKAPAATKAEDVAPATTPEISRTAKVEKKAAGKSTDRPGTSLPPVEAIPTDAISPLPFEVSDKPNPQHKYLQSLVKRIGEHKGFRASLEKEVFGGAGRIDVALENESIRIAVEISATNEPQYELRNIQKCLAANFDPVVMISADARHLEKIGQLAGQTLSPEDFAKTRYFSPEEFHAWLENLGSEPSEKTEKVKGFKVNVKLKPVEAAERGARKKAISDIVFGALKKLKKSDSEK
jgi:hypothetical protein